MIYKQHPYHWTAFTRWQFLWQYTEICFLIVIHSGKSYVTNVDVEHNDIILSVVFILLQAAFRGTKIFRRTYFSAFIPFPIVSRKVVGHQSFGRIHLRLQIICTWYVSGRIISLTFKKVAFAQNPVQVIIFGCWDMGTLIVSGF